MTPTTKRAIRQVFLTEREAMPDATEKLHAPDKDISGPCAGNQCTEQIIP